MKLSKEKQTETIPLGSTLLPPSQKCNSSKYIRRSQSALGMIKPTNWWLLSVTAAKYLMMFGWLRCLIFPSSSRTSALLPAAATLTAKCLSVNCSLTCMHVEHVPCPSFRSESKSWPCHLKTGRSSALTAVMASRGVCTFQWLIWPAIAFACSLHESVCLWSFMYPHRWLKAFLVWTMVFFLNRLEASSTVHHADRRGQGTRHILKVHVSVQGTCLYASVAWGQRQAKSRDYWDDQQTFNQTYYYNCILNYSIKTIKKQ